MCSPVFMEGVYPDMGRGLSYSSCSYKMLEVRFD